MPQGVTAIVPAYNEAERIGAVLTVLVRVPELAEIVVVDDGSTDGTPEVVKRFPGVRLLQHKANRGKAQALARGVAVAACDVLFFCDADIQGLTVATVRDILRPVLEGEVDMSVGICSNVLQRAVTEVALLSGVRALRRSLWDKTPGRYKRGFRIEVGLSAYAKRIGARVVARQYPHSHVVKEAKYGFWKGLAWRWRLNWDVVMAAWYALMRR